MQQTINYLFDPKINEIFICNGKICFLDEEYNKHEIVKCNGKWEIKEDEEEEELDTYTWIYEGKEYQVNCNTISGDSHLREVYKENDDGDGYWICGYAIQKDEHGTEFEWVG
jgi:hypothetical protein